MLIHCNTENKFDNRSAGVYIKGDGKLKLNVDINTSIVNVSHPLNASIHPHSDYRTHLGMVIFSPATNDNELSGTPIISHTL